MSDVTQLLEAAAAGDGQAAAAILPLVYDELRKLAAARMAAESPGNTLDATALVHEAYLRLIGDQKFEHRGHFFAAAAEAMRRILVDQARRKLAVRHGGEWHRVTELRDLPDVQQEPEQTVIVHELLDHLAKTHARQAEVAKMRLFLQFTFVAIAEATGLSADTAESDWAFARAWLKREWGQKSGLTSPLITGTGGEEKCDP